MGYQFNPFTGNFDIIGNSNSGSKAVFIAFQNGNDADFGTGGQTLVDLSAGTGTVLRFPTVVTDNYSAFSSNKCEYVIPNTGVYLVATSIGVSTMAANCSIYYASIVDAPLTLATDIGLPADAFYTYNGAADYYFQINTGFNGSSGDNIIQGFYVKEFTQGQTIAIAFYQNSGTDAKTFLFGNNSRYTSFMIHQLS